LFLGKAAELAKVNVIEFKELLKNREIMRKIKATRKDMKKADELVKKISSLSSIVL